MLGILQDQKELVAFLSSPEQHGGVQPAHLETVLSHLFLGPDKAYKLKKALRWSVVDYSTPGIRHAMCVREFDVNRQFAPELYLGVESVTTGPDGLVLGGSGPAVDTVVVMRRFAKGDQLDEVLETGRFTPALAEATADTVAKLHKVSRPCRLKDQVGRVLSLVGQLSADTAAEDIGEDLRSEVQAFGPACGALVQRLGPFLSARARHGFVRRCHGDLHLSNLCLLEGRPTAFDAIEFSEDIGMVDVVHDLAFVLIDLEARGRRDLSARLLSRYLEVTRDYGGLKILPLFKALRHMVRALMGAKKGRDTSHHIAAARAEIAPRASPSLIAIGGLSGTGKTTVARALLARSDAVVIRSDVARKHLAGVAPEEKLPDSAYAADRSGAVYQRVMRDGRRALRAGTSVILDAAFLSPAERAAAETLASDCGVSFQGVWLEAPNALLVERVAARTADASDADTAVLAKQSAGDVGPLSWDRFDASGAADDTAGAILTRADRQ